MTDSIATITGPHQAGVNGLWAAIGHTPAQVDQLFRDAEAYANA